MRGVGPLLLVGLLATGKVEVPPVGGVTVASSFTHGLGTRLV